MRSLGFTLILGLLAVLACTGAVWQWVRGNFDSILGAPPTPIGQRIYSKFSPADVKHIQVSQNGVNATFSLTENGWHATGTSTDRMDPRAAISIIDFTLALQVEDFAPRDELDSQKVGLRESSVTIRLENAARQPLAKYKLGRQTPWLTLIKDERNPAPTVFVQPRDDDHRRYIYACTGDISPLFKENLKFLRDHHPLYFNPLALQKLRIRAEQGELTLSRETPKSPWRVTKPLDLATDPAAVKTLLEGLYELTALKVSDRAAVTLPANTSAARAAQIAISHFGSELETVLEISPPETPDARSVYATVSDRPNTVFELPFKPEPSLVSLASLPLAINELRDTALTNLNLKAIQSITIQPANSPEILVTRTPPQPWMATIAGQSQLANEERLFTLFKTVTESRASGFETDAATDFTPWGLDRPFLKLRFLATNQQALELNFGLDGKGGFFANRVGTPTVIRIDAAVISSLPVRAHEWRFARLWSLDQTSLVGIERVKSGEAPLLLRYDFAREAWSATRENQDVSATLDPTRADFLLRSLEGLQVSRWLAPGDAAANTALLKPSLAFKVLEKTTNDLGDFSGIATREILLAPVGTAATPFFYYGRLSTDSQPFLLDREIYEKLRIELFEK